MGLAPLGLGLVAALIAMLTGHSPVAAAKVLGLTAGLTCVPMGVACVGWWRSNRRLIRGALVLVILEVFALGWAGSPGRKTDFSVPKLDAAVTQSRLRYASEQAYAAVVRAAQTVASKGSRQTGSQGLSDTLDFVRDALRARGLTGPVAGDPEHLADPPAEGVIRRTEFSVLAPEDEGSVLELCDAQGSVLERLPAYALQPNLIQPCRTSEAGLRAPLAYLGFGRDADLEGQAVAGKLAVFEFASDEAWLWACEHGALGALFLESSDGAGESVRQADQKYLALVPLNFPRAYVKDAHHPGAPHGICKLVREAARAGRTAVLHARMRLRTVPAPIYEVFVRGTRSPRELLIMTHADARAIAPALSFGGQEAFSIGAWLALHAHFAQYPPAFSLRFVLTTGHWQAQAAGRAYAQALKDAMGARIAMAIGVDLNPESDALMVTDDSVSDCSHPSYFWWLKKLLFTVNRLEPAWIDQLEALSSRPVTDRGGDPSKYAFYGGRSTLPASQWRLWLAPLDKWPPSTQSASHPTAEQMFAQIGGLSIAFRTCNTYRQRHFTCRDRIEPWLEQVERLRPQLELTFALIGALADLDPAEFPAISAYPHHVSGGYNRVDVQILKWKPEIIWYERKPPPGERTFAVLVPSDSYFFKGRSFAYWPRPVAPSRFLHRQLQCFQALYMAEVDAEGRATFENVYCRNAQAAQDALAFTLDHQGRLTHAFDQGFHGDVEFRFLDRPLSAPHMRFQVPIAPCGVLTLFSLVNPDRFSVDTAVEHEYVRQYGGRHDQDDGESPYLPVQGVREVETHTEADAYAWIQYRQTAMVFLKPGQRCEILAGSPAQKPMLFNDDPVLRKAWTEAARAEGVTLAAIAARHDRESAGRPPAKPAADGGATPADGGASAHSAADPAYLGFRVAQGEDRRLFDTARLAGEQLSRLTSKRLAEYAERNVRSPAANVAQARAQLHAAHAQEERGAGHTATASAAETLAWSAQARAYRGSYRLLLDVVSTAIFYFVLLMPFGYLVERLLFPQPALWRTGLASAAVFVLFATLLYFFHPGFHLAENIFVTAVTFVILVLTLPALFIIATRGLALALASGARFKRRHTADAERWGVLGAALSLAVNNMRRRKLRTSLTLATITILVTSLVLLTSTAAHTEFYREAQALPNARYRGVQVVNAHNHTHGMSELTARSIERRYGHEARVLRRSYFSPGFESSVACCALEPAKAGSAEGPGKAFELRGVVALDPEEQEVSRLDTAICAGRFFRKGDTRVCLLAEDLARRLNLRLGATVRAFGVDLELIGLLRSFTVDADLEDLSGKALTPIAFYRPILTVDSPDHLLANETLFVPGELIRVEQPIPVPVFSVVVAPRKPERAAVLEQAGRMRAWLEASNADPVGEPQARLVRAAQGALNEEEAARILGAPGDREVLEEAAAYNLERRALRRIAEECAEEYAKVDVYVTQPEPPWRAGAQDRVELLLAMPLVSLQSGSFLVLPFLISFLMLLVIMIGGVYERRREIHVFSSVGLAPRHVAGMFLAEALVYAGIASVLGYFIGIILLDLFQRAALLPPNFYPNYFGKVVIWSAVLATSASVLSVLYPMWIAARMVNPSLERIWKIETQPEGDRWIIHLPFVAHDRREVIGVLKFVGEFLDFHRGERTGAFAMEDDFRFEREGETAVLRGGIWLAPFEQNLVQQMVLRSRYDPRKERYHFDLEVTRCSGPDPLWRKSNHALVDGIRKQMLIWRSLEDSAVQEYIVAGEAALGAQG